jgi:hypothetical protein
MAPSAKAFNYTSGHVTSYLNLLSSRFTGFRRTRSIDGESAPEETELQPREKRLLPNGQPFSQTNTIDRMLIQMKPESETLQTVREV